MPALISREFSSELRLAASVADRDGTAALNTLVYGGTLMIASAVALVAVGGIAGVFLWAIVWLLGLASVAVWLAPHVAAARRWQYDRAAQQRVLLSTARERAVDLLLSDDVSAETRRAAANLLAEATPREQPQPTRAALPERKEPK